MGGFRLGSLFGIEIRIDYSWFIIFFLILWTFTMGVFPASFPGLAGGTYLAMGAVGTLLFFASLLAHELSHSIVARSKGIPVEGITLFIFGGMAHTGAEFERPGDEFVIAGVGPLSSLLIALLFGALAWLGVQAGWSVAVVGVAQYLAFINLVLALFNLLPGFPLDGGRLFRAALWKYTGDLRRATRAASLGGKVLGFLLIALGVMQLFFGNLIGGMWAILIGWFVRSAAQASYTHHLLRSSLRGVRARDIMTADPQTVPAEATLEQFVAEYLFRGGHHGYPVTEGESPVGIITLRRVKEIPREEWSQRTVGQAMAPAEDGMLAHPDASMDRVLEQIEGSPAGRVLVTREGQLAGIITRSDVARWLERIRLLER